MTFSSSSKTRHTSCCPHQSRSASPMRDRVPCESPAWTPLLGLSKDCPFVDTCFERPLLFVSGSFRRICRSLPSTRNCHLLVRSALVVPPDFDGLLRSNTAGLLHPAADPGVRPVSDRSLPVLALLAVTSWDVPTSFARKVGGSHLFPSIGIRRSSSWRSAIARSSPWRVHPSKVFPRSQPCLRFRLPSARCAPERAPWLRSTSSQPVPPRCSAGVFPLTTWSSPGFSRRFHRVPPCSQVSDSSLSLEVFIRVRVRCRLRRLSLPPARSSLGLGFLLLFLVERATLALLRKAVELRVPDWPEGPSESESGSSRRTHLLLAPGCVGFDDRGLLTIAAPASGPRRPMGPVCRFSLTAESTLRVLPPRWRVAAAGLDGDPASRHPKASRRDPFTRSCGLSSLPKGWWSGCRAGRLDSQRLRFGALGPLTTLVMSFPRRLWLPGTLRFPYTCPEGWVVGFRRTG